MPFFTPLWAGIPVFMLIFQLAREVWWYESPFPLNAMGYFIEPIYLTAYRRVPVFTISKSTENDLLRMRFSGPITVMPIGIEEVNSTPTSPADDPTFTYVGRLAPSKRISHMLQALAQFRAVGGKGVLWLVGDGSKRYRQSLTRLARSLGIEDHVVFWGRVPAVEKHRLMSQSSSLLMTSVREGWGLVVTEANACGTPAIVYDVPGLRDSVVNESTGLVVPPSPQNLSAAMLRMTADPTLRSRLSVQAKAWSATFSYDKAATLVELALKEARVA